MILLGLSLTYYILKEESNYIEFNQTNVDEYYGYIQLIKCPYCNATGEYLKPFASQIDNDNKPPLKAISIYFCNNCSHEFIALVK